MDNAFISLSFDDGRGDNLSVFRNLLIPMSLPATLNVTTGYIDGSCPVDRCPSQKKPIPLNDLRNLYHSGYVEIALHGDQHQNTWEDILIGRQKLVQWLDLPEQWSLGFASPGSGMAINDFIQNKALCKKYGIKYMRTSLRIQNATLLRILCRKTARVLHLPLLYRIAYADTVMTDCDNHIVYSIPVMRDTTVQELKAIIDQCIRQKGALTLMFHSVLANVEGEDNWTWPLDLMEELCTYLVRQRESGCLKTVTTMELVNALHGEYE